MKYNYPYKNASNELVQAIWEKANIVEGYNPDIYRKDAYGWWIYYHDHGNENSEYGWEIDHIKPTAKGGSDDISNLQPLYWKNNRYKADKYPWDC
ncbi:MAG: HNH endonuclease signature motif containing protein [Ignavibacteria bacterium]|jgi:hypothetical protein